MSLLVVLGMCTHVNNTLITGLPVHFADNVSVV